jgi:hypothetical protein
MRELVQQSTSSSTELAAAADQMSKLSRALLTSMDRFAIDVAKPEARRSPTRTAGFADEERESLDYEESTVS